MKELENGDKRRLREIIEKKVKLQSKIFEEKKKY